VRRFPLIVLLIANAALADGTYTGPAHPTIPSDSRPIQATHAACLARIKELTAWPDAETEAATKDLCALRSKHATARRHLTDRLAALVAELKDVTNHEHAQNLPATIGNIQAMVKQCVATLESQQYCHNIACAMEPEDNAIFCETQAASLVDRIASAGSS
jgi:membrane-bound ClpP family serine protease